MRVQRGLCVTVTGGVQSRRLLLGRCSRGARGVLVGLFVRGFREFFASFCKAFIFSKGSQVVRDVREAFTGLSQGFRKAFAVISQCCRRGYES